MDPVSIIMGLAQFVPALVRWAKGDKAGDMAEKAVAVAQTLTGESEPNAAIEAVKKDPALAVKFQEQMTQVVVAELDAENRQLESINATIRAEAASGDKYVSRWRPTFGYIVSFTWLAQMVALTWVTVRHPDKAAAVLTAAAGLSVMWSVALTVLGVQVVKRSQDKQVAAGQVPGVGIVGALAARIAGGGE